MKNIYIILSQSGTEISKMLRAITKEQYNHSSICITDTFNEFYSFSRKKLNNPLIGGFVIENAFKHVFGKFKTVPCMILKLEITDEQYVTLEKILKDFIKNKDKLSYAFVTLALADTKYSLVTDTKFFCSQFVAKLLNDIDIKTPKAPEHMHPMDFTLVKNVEKIYEGDLKEFCSNTNLRLTHLNELIN